MTTSTPDDIIQNRSANQPQFPPDGQHDRPYWQADGFVDSLLREFLAGLSAHEDAAVRERFYVLARFYRRTLAILHDALQQRNERLAGASLHNLVVFERALLAMHAIAPNSAPSLLALESNLHAQLNRDLVHRILRESGAALSLDTISERFNSLDLLADARPSAIREAVESLVGSGQARARAGRYQATGLDYTEADLNSAGLALLLGNTLAEALAPAGFQGLNDILARRDEFQQALEAQTGFRAATTAQFLTAAETLAKPIALIRAAGSLEHADLAGSAHPRPFQRRAFAILRGGGFDRQIIDAPTGSGKTLVGMLCIQDWLDLLAPGQTVLVLVPTINDRQQWFSELCLNDVGLRLAPNRVYAGTPAGLTRLRAAHHRGPSVAVLTYAALSQLASSKETSGFDAATVERFLQEARIRAVILDEAHKVVEKNGSSAGKLARLLAEWRANGRLTALIGFSGTAAPFRSRFEALGLCLAAEFFTASLVAEGYVAPLAEFGAPFGYSDRERQIAGLIQRYRDQVLSFVQRLGNEQIRGWFAAIPLEKRHLVARRMGMYQDLPDRNERITRRLRAWESGGDITLSELGIVEIIQLAHGWSDEDLMAAACGGDRVVARARYFAIRSELEGIRRQLQQHIPRGSLRAGLDVNAAGGAPGVDIDADSGVGLRAARARTAAGLYHYLRDWPRQAGEGRVAVIGSIVDAETAVRSTPAVIIFDRSRPLKWRAGPVIAGYQGIGGVFGQLLGRPGLTPMAALAGEIYLPDRDNSPLQAAIADWILRAVVLEQQGSLLFTLIAKGGRLNPDQAAHFRRAFDAVYRRYVDVLTSRCAIRLGDVNQLLIRPLRRSIRGMRLGKHRYAVLGWLRTDQYHLRAVLDTIADYVTLAAAFRNARRGELVQADGTHRHFRVIAVPGGKRRQLLYALTARIVDTTSLGVNVIIVSSWARTGWNIITPNVLIDATATRDVIAWRQLRGRAMRPGPTWNPTCRAVLRKLLSGGAAGTPLDGALGNGPDAAVSGEPWSDAERELLLAIARQAHSLTAPAFEAAAGASTEASARLQGIDLAAQLLVQRNKVTHIYELVRAHGSVPQVRHDRRSRRWERIDSIAAKHGREEAVSPIDGVLAQSSEHAPLVVVDDPRTDEPRAFRRGLQALLVDADARIARGWLLARQPPDAQG